MVVVPLNDDEDDMIDGGRWCGVAVRMFTNTASVLPRCVTLGRLLYELALWSGRKARVP